MAFPYPPSPLNVPESVTAIRPGFKKEVVRTTWSILFFFIVYIVLFLLSLALAAACVYGGVAVLLALGGTWGILLGLGLIGVGLMVFFFLIKFLFAVNKYDRSGMIEITETEQPLLFAFIRKLAADTGTPFPKHIYLSADVNASVFYDSSFLSMFLPIRKNLNIGLGLVNVINLSEFKAVIAHEFGHFSQRSMKLGSFVYNVNRVLYNMLYENNSYSTLLSRWASIHGFFAIFASITAYIVRGIQWILQQVYGLVNKSYMSLSREMEFHADAVSASVSGSQSLVTALKRLDFGSAGYELVLNKYGELLQERKFSRNLYRDQQHVVGLVAADNKTPLENGLPVVDRHELESPKYARVNFKDQWASHPSHEDREKHLNELNVVAEADTRSAWLLFTNTEVLQQQLTEYIYKDVERQDKDQQLAEADFARAFDEGRRLDAFPEAYNGFYDARYYTQLVMTELVRDIPAAPLEKEAIFSTANGLIQKRINGIRQDMAILKAIQEKQLDTKSFDFDGVKYNRSEAGVLEQRLQIEVEELEEKQKTLDVQAVQYFLQRTHGTDREQLIALYSQWMEERLAANGFLERINAMLHSLSPIYSGQTVTFDEIDVIIKGLKQKHEPQFKEDLRIWLSRGVARENTALLEQIEKFIAADYQYFSGTSFFENELKELDQLCRLFWDEMNKYLHVMCKGILERQLEVAGSR